MRRITLIPLLASALAVPSFAQTATIRSAAGSAGSIQASVTSFLADLGGNNNGAQPPQSSGHRGINWDGVPDGDSAPSRFPGNFFNKVSTRGAEFFTPGSSFQVSADSANPSATAPLFGNLVANHGTSFAAFTTERVFTALGSNIIEVHFRLAGTDTKAAVRGFGAVFCDVDASSVTFINYYSGSRLLHQEPAIAAAGSGLLSFVGVSFIAPIVTHVRMTMGDSATGPNVDDISNGGGFPDVVVVDDFFYGEPLPLDLHVLTRAIPDALRLLGLDASNEARFVRGASKLTALAESIESAAHAEDAAGESKLLDRLLKELTKLQLKLGVGSNNELVQAFLATHLSCTIDLVLKRKSLLTHS